MNKLLESLARLIDRSDAVDLGGLLIISALVSATVIVALAIALSL